MDTYFRGWAKPGPIPPGASRDIEVSADETLDALSGHFRLYQLRKGQPLPDRRVLTAWYGTTWAPSARTALDLGSGIGSVGMIAAWRLPGARFVTIEAQEASVRLAGKSAAYNGLLDRYAIRHGDFRDAVMLGENERFDLVLGGPPYFPPGTGIEGDHAQKIACRFEMRGDIRDYCRVASQHLAPGGVFACVFPEEQRERVEEGSHAASLAIVRRRPVVFREGEPPLVTLFLLMRRNDLPEAFRDQTWIEPALIIRTMAGAVHPEYAAVKLAVGFSP